MNNSIVKDFKKCIASILVKKYKISEFEAMKAKYGDICESDEDVLSCALFENVAVKFLENRKNKQNKKEETTDEVISFNVYIGGN